MTRLFLRPLAVAVLTSCLVACFDIDQSLTVTDTGSATFNFAFTLDSELLGQADEMDIDPESNCDKDDWLDTLPSDLTYVSDVRFEGSKLICEYAVTGPLTSFESLSSQVDREVGSADFLALEILDDHRARITGTYSFSEGDEVLADEEGVLGKSIKRMIAVNFEGHFIRWTVRAPTVLESNGDIAVDGRSVTWSLPLEEAIMNDQDYRFEAIIDYTTHRPRFF